MKKILLAGIALFFCVTVSFAQTTYGLKGGLNVASVRIPDNQVDPMLGVHVGGFVSAPISDRFALQPELLYSQQGYNTQKYDYRFHYLNLPLIFKGTISGGLHAQVGPQFGVLLRANRTEGKTSKDITETVSRFDSALALGLGYDLSSLQFSARYTLGLTDTDETADRGFNGFTNNVFQLSLGVRL